MLNRNNNFQSDADQTSSAAIFYGMLYSSLSLWKYSMPYCRIKHFNLSRKLFWLHCVLFFIKKLFDSSSVAIEKSWTIIGDEDDKSKTIANYSNVWCVVQTCTYIPTSWINKEAKKIHESWCNFGFEKSFIIPDALIKRGGGDFEVSLGDCNITL